MRTPFLVKVGLWAASGLALATVAGLGFSWWHFSPPRESALAEQFRSNRAAFEALRKLLLEEAGEVDVAAWGVRRPSQSFVPEVPPDGGFPRARFDEYLALLDRAGGAAAFREDGPCPETCVSVWGSGWAGDTLHVAICAVCAPPTNLVESLDAWWTARAGTSGRRFVYRHLDGEWYLRADQ